MLVVGGMEFRVKAQPNGARMDDGDVLAPLTFLEASFFELHALPPWILGESPALDVLMLLGPTTMASRRFLGRHPLPEGVVEESPMTRLQDPFVRYVMTDRASCCSSLWFRVWWV
jgi:hypothetical protein